MKAFNPWALFWRFVLFVGLVAPFVACHPVYVPRAQLQAGKASATQAGAVRAPAIAESRESRRSIPLPAASQLLFDDSRPGLLALRLSQDSVLLESSTADRVSGPESFPPPSPPSPQEKARGKAVFWMWIGLPAGVVALLFGLVRNWDLVALGGGAVAGACALGLFVAAHPVLFAVAGVGVALAVVGPWLWHTRIRPAIAAAPA